MLEIFIYAQVEGKRELVNILKTEDYHLKMKYGELINKLFGKNVAWEYIPLDIISEKNFYQKPFTDYYGQVKFNVFADDLTIEEIIFYYGNGTNRINIALTQTGKGGGGDILPKLIEVLMEMYDFANFLLKEHPLLILGLSHLGKKSVELRKFLKKYDDLNVYAGTYIDYIHSKEYWTMEELKIRFDEENTEILDLLMKLSLFGYDKEKESYVLIENYQDGRFMNLTVLDMIEIIKYYILDLKKEIKYINLDNEYHSFDYLKEKLTIEISDEKLLEIFRLLEQEKNEVAKE